jgi:hypothetical protein
MAESDDIYTYHETVHHERNNATEAPFSVEPHLGEPSRCPSLVIHPQYRRIEAESMSKTDSGWRPAPGCLIHTTYTYVRIYVVRLILLYDMTNAW